METLLGKSIKDYYYGSAERIVYAQAETVSGLLSKYHSEGSGDYEEYFRGIVTSFEKRNIMELMVLNEEGEVVITSSGFLPEEDFMTPDCFEAKNSVEKTAEFIGDINGEKIISVTVVPEGSTTGFASFRLVASVEKIDSQIIFAIIGTSFVCIAIIFFVVVFINSLSVNVMCFIYLYVGSVLFISFIFSQIIF